MMKRENLFQKKVSPQDNERSKQLTLAEKTGNLKLGAFSLNCWPQPMFQLTSLKIIDLSFNNIEAIPPEIKIFQDLVALYINNNPLSVVPVEIAECKKLKTLDLSTTLVKWLPREMAELKFLSEVNLKDCPLKTNLSNSYDMGINTLMFYFERKFDRRKYKELIVRYLKEWIYVNDKEEVIRSNVDNVFNYMKDLETKHFKRMLKNAQYLFPKDIRNINPGKIKQQLLDSFNERTLTMTKTNKTLY